MLALCHAMPSPLPPPPRQRPERSDIDSVLLEPLNIVLVLTETSQDRPFSPPSWLLLVHQWQGQPRPPGWLRRTPRDPPGTASLPRPAAMASMAERQSEVATSETHLLESEVDVGNEGGDVTDSIAERMRQACLRGNANLNQWA